MGTKLNKIAKNFAAFVNKSRSSYFQYVIFFLGFLAVAFDWELALTYVVLIVADKWWAETNSRIPLSNGKRSLQVYIESIAAFGLFLLVSTLIVNYFSPQSISNGIIGGAQSIFQMLSASTPILKGSKILTFIGWAIMVPIIETSLFNNRLYDGLARYASRVTGRKIDIFKYSMIVIVLVFVVAALFTLFHITAKGLDSIPLLITFIFSIISSILVIRHRQAKGAILLHILANGAAVLSSFGIL